jgi:hypothetical protein
VVDEAHRLKNLNSLLYKTLSQVLIYSIKHFLKYLFKYLNYKHHLHYKTLSQILIYTMELCLVYFLYSLHYNTVLGIDLFYKTLSHVLIYTTIPNTISCI